MYIHTKHIHTVTSGYHIRTPYVGTSNENDGDKSLPDGDKSVVFGDKSFNPDGVADSCTSNPVPVACATSDDDDESDAVVGGEGGSADASCGGEGGSAALSCGGEGGRADASCGEGGRAAANGVVACMVSSSSISSMVSLVWSTSW